MTIDELLKSEHGGLIKSYTDSRVMQGIKKYSEGHPTEEGMLARLEIIETTASEKIRAAELKTYLTRQSLKAGIEPADLEDLGVTFADEADVDAKISKYKILREKQDLENLNKKLIENSLKPGSGNPGYNDSSDITRAMFEQMTKSEQAALEQSGELNRLIKKWNV